MDGAVLREERRVERLAQAGLQWRGHLGGDTYLLIEAQYARNEATPPAYDYDRFTGLLGVEWVPARD